MHLKGARVLIVEDDFMVAMAAKDMVECLGGVVAGTARSVAVAKEKIRHPGLDCVMLDVNLNGDLSLGIAAELQEREIPFVFCTAYSHAFDGFEHVPRVRKPYCEHDLVAAFNEVPVRI
jgi:response regulator of citrate/malate metabolism